MNLRIHSEENFESKPESSEETPEHLDPTKEIVGQARFYSEKLETAVQENKYDRIETAAKQALGFVYFATEYSKDTESILALKELTEAAESAVTRDNQIVDHDAFEQVRARLDDHRSRMAA